MSTRKNHTYKHCLYFSIATCFFLWHSFLPASAQSAEEKGLPFITNYSIKDYHAHPQNWAIIEDNQGIMYFGNSICLLEYDGVKWRKLNFGNNTLVRSLAKDKDGRIYFGSYSEFGFLAPDSLGQMQLQSLTKYIPVAYRNFNYIFSINITDDGIYFQSRNLIFRFKPNNGDKKKWDVKIWESANKFMYAFYLDGTYYVHEQGIGLLKMTAGKLVLIPGSEFLGNERLQVMLPYPANKDTQKQYLLGLFYGGLYLFNGKTFTPFKSEADSIFKSATLYKGALLNDGSYALSTTGKGLVIMSPEGKIIQLLNRDVGLQDESVYTVFTDKKGVLWLGLDNGISRVETSSPFKQFTIQSGISNAVLSISRFEDVIYLGTANGLIRFNARKAKFEPVPSLGTNQVFDLIADKDLLLVPADGLYSIENDRTHLLKASLGGDFQIQSLYALKKIPGILLAGTTGGLGIFSKSIAGKKEAGEDLKDWRFAGFIPGVAADIWNMADGSRKSLLLGSNEGAFRISNFLDSNNIPVLDKVTVETFGTAQGLSGGAIHVFSVADKEFFVSNKAVFSYDEKKKRFISDSSLGNMAFGNDPNEYTMTEDYKGRLWINFGKVTELATPLANGKYKIENTQFLSFTDRVIYKIYPEKNGTIWFATNEGLIKYDEANEKNYDQPYKTLIRSVAAGQTALNPGSGTGPSQSSSISYKNNALRFEYASPFFDQENKTQYETWLEPFDAGWTGWGSNFYKEYTNLPEGKYTFHVRAKNIYQKISEEATYTFIIQPPWWRTWWAYSLYAIIVLGTLWIFFKWRLRLLGKEKLLLEEKVITRTKELQQEKNKVELALSELTSAQTQLIQAEKMASLGELTAGIAHEIQNPLNFVNNFSDVNTELLDELQDEIEKGNLAEVVALARDIRDNEEKINHHGKRADSIVKGMLQHSRSSSGIKEPTNINTLADEYLRLSYHGLRAKEKSFNATLNTFYDESIGKINIIPQDIGRVLLNLYSNAFYAIKPPNPLKGENYEPTITVRTKLLKPSPAGGGFEVELTVRDNGNGIPQNIVDKIFQPFFTTKPTGQGTGLGLSLSYDIIKAHGGEIKVNTIEGEFTEFVILLPFV